MSATDRLTPRPVPPSVQFQKAELAAELVRYGAELFRDPAFGPKAVALMATSAGLPLSDRAQAAHFAYHAAKRALETLCEDGRGASTGYEETQTLIDAAWYAAYPEREGEPDPQPANRRKGPRRKADQIAQHADEAAAIAVDLLERLEDPDTLESLIGILGGAYAHSMLPVDFAAFRKAYDAMYELAGGRKDNPRALPTIDAAFADAVQRQKAARQTDGGAR